MEAAEERARARRMCNFSIRPQSSLSSKAIKLTLPPHRFRRRCSKRHYFFYPKRFLFYQNTKVFVFLSIRDFHVLCSSAGFSSERKPCGGDGKFASAAVRDWKQRISRDWNVKILAKFFSAGRRRHSASWDYICGRILRLRFPNNS